MGRHGEVRNFVLPETFVAVLPTRTLSWLFRGSGEPALVSSGFLGSRAGLFLGPDGQTHFVMKDCLWTRRNSAQKLHFVCAFRKYYEEASESLRSCGKQDTRSEWAHNCITHASMKTFFIVYGFVTFERLQKRWGFVEKPW